MQTDSIELHLNKYIITNVIIKSSAVWMQLIMQLLLDKFIPNVIVTSHKMTAKSLW